ncbi:hypothetical protein LJR225_004326 [Phenylobacterium sp. LjRoot225]|uniref:hypothetical protein n=1 Tax=Phenylobacterium sp. LjRoot225 TaxID=3342285 RepID=UPI003ECDC3B7
MIVAAVPVPPIPVLDPRIQVATATIIVAALLDAALLDAALLDATVTLPDAVSVGPVRPAGPGRRTVGPAVIQGRARGERAGGAAGAAGAGGAGWASGTAAS